MFNIFKSNNAVSNYVSNAVDSLASFQRNAFNRSLGVFFGGNRDVYKAMDYPRTLKPSNYINYYDRHAIAKSVIKAYPDACWRLHPAIIENEDQENTQFENDVNNLIDKLKMFKYFKRADISAGVLSYAVILIGFKDGLTMDKPSIGGEVAYFQAFGETDMQILTYNNNSSNERFGKPEYYQIKTDENSTAKKVHWTRIIHIAEDCDNGDLFGTPRIKSVYNNLYDIEKISASSAEGYWRNGTGGIVAEYDKDATIDEAASKLFKEKMSKYVDGFERSLLVKGGEIKSLSIDMNDPTAFFMIQIQQISAEKKIPQRILLGSEQGKLAAGQDSEAWLDNVAARQVNFCDIDIIRPVIDRLIELGSIAKPVSYSIAWQDLKVTDSKTKAETAKLKTEALVRYGDSAMTQAIMPVELFLSSVIGLTAEEIETIDIKATEDLTDDESLKNEPTE